jgi:hypothetical protein
MTLPNSDDSAPSADVGTPTTPSERPTETLSSAAPVRLTEHTEVREAAVASPSRSVEAEGQFLLNEQRYLLESAKFADQKAAFAFAFSLGSLAFLFQQKVFVGVFGNDTAANGINAVGLLAGVALLASCGLLLFAVLPRLWWSSKHRLNLVFWEDVAALGSADKYFEAVRMAGPDTLHREISDHCFTLAAICERKFTAVKWGMWIGVVGSVLGVIAIRV